MEEQSQQADAADLARFDYIQDLRLAQTIEGQALERANGNEMPHGGYKQSGYGKDMGVYSLEEYTQIKHVVASHD